MRFVRLLVFIVGLAAGATVVAAALAIGGCATIKPVPASDATCSDVCSRGTVLGCTWALPTPKGHTCLEVCSNATAVGNPWRLSCMARADTCEAAQCP